MLAALAVAASLMTLAAACGDKGTPNASPTTTDEGTLETATPSPTTDASATQPPVVVTTTTTTTQAANPYPNNAKDYGLALLAGIKANNETRIVDLSSSSVYQNVTANNYSNLNGQWTYSNCESGACFYYNATGSYAQVGIDGSKVGKAHAGTYVSVEGHTFRTDALGYISDLINAWQNGSLVGMNALATDSAVSFLRGGRMIPTGSVFTAAQACGSGKVCAASGTEVAGGQPFGQITCYTVQTDRMGKADAIVGAKDGFCS